MSFSKRTLISAALFLGTVAGTPFTAFAEEWTDNKVGNITVTSDLEIEIAKGKAYTFSGSFLSENGSYVDSLINTGGTPARDTQTITISGGGTLQYSGTAGSGYYTDNYTLTRGDAATSDRVLSAWKDFDSFLSAGVFTGTIKVSGEGTTLNLKGQLAQYVLLYAPTTRDASDIATGAYSEHWGANIELEDGATLSFEKSSLNLSDSALWQNPLATRVNALNFVKNLKSDASSKIVIGTDEGSYNRIAFYTDRVNTNTSTIGRLSGNGRIYVIGGGYAAFIGESELNSGTDTTGNLWTSGNRLADVVISNTRTFVGVNIFDGTGSATSAAGLTVMSDKEALAAAVDNVFAGATAVHLGTETIVSSVTGSPTVTAGAVVSNAGGAFTNLSVYGNQIFNNFQSLWLERSELTTDYDLFTLRLSEPYVFHHWDSTTNTLSPSMGIMTSVRVGGGSVLTINQDVGRDGRYRGQIVTSLGRTAWESDYEGLADNGDGLVVKTGKGKIFYDPAFTSRGTLSRLRVEDGTWVSSLSGADGMTVQVVGDGVFEILVDAETDQISTNIKGSGDLSLSRFVLLENGLSEDSAASIGTDGWEPEYRKYLANYLDSGAAGVQFTKEQTQFTGSIIVNDGLTLKLGEADEGANSPSIFSSAESIILRGVDISSSRYAECDSSSRDILGRFILEDYTDSALQYSTLQVLSGVQLVKNLIGDANYSRVYVEHGATLVLTRTMSDTSFNGGISGNGNLINLGGAQAVRVDTTGDLFGTLTVLSGSVSVAQTNANAGFSGLVLGNDGRATFAYGDGTTKVGMLIGEEGTSVSASGDLIVGNTQNSSGFSGKDGEYFATSNYSTNYGTYFAGTSAESVLTTLENRATAARGGVHTVDKANAYLKNPANLIYTTDSNVYDGAFSRLYATTGTNRNRESVFQKMYDGAAARSADATTAADPGNNACRYDFGDGATTADTLFRTGETVAEWLKKTFTVEYVTDFINSSSAQLSAATKASLLDMANLIASGDTGVCTYLDGSNPSTANLNVEGWNKLVAAGALEYLKAAYPDAGLSDLDDETLYAFITLFYPDDETYEFVKTDRNLALISSTYGVSFPTTASYADIVATFGVESAEFAGTLSGALNLTKQGAETLTLTGVNSYTGTTTVTAGELRIDWNAIQNTAGIVVKDGALLTINGELSDIQEAHKNPETGTYYSGYTDDSPGDLFVSGSRARLSGSGVVLKIGDGVVDLGNALLGGDSSDQYFTGTFIVGNGGLIGTINPKASEAPTFNIDFSKGSSSTFRLNFYRDGGSYVSRSASDGAVETVFGGEIAGVDGAGTFILDAGISGYIGTDGSLVSLGNNTLTVSASKFSPGAVEVKSGNLKIDFDTAGTTVPTASYTLAKNVSLIFKLSESGAVVENADISGVADGNNTLRIVSDETDSDTGAYTEKTLKLDNVAIANISSLVLDGGVALTLTGVSTTTEGRETVLYLDSLTTGTQTSLNLDGRKVELNVSSGEKSVIGGTFTGEGTFTFSGEDADESAGTAAGTLVLGNTGASSSETEVEGFSGEIVFENGTIEMAVGENRTVTYTGLTLSDGGVVGTRTLEKTGAGTAWIAPNDDADNTISVSNLSVNVSAGTLKVGATLFTTLPVAVNIEKDATFCFTDPLTSFTLSDLGTLSGAGTLAFETSGTEEVTVTANESVSDNFKGIINVGENITLDLDSSVEKFSAFAGAGTVNVNSGSLTVEVDANDDAAQSFSGTITGLTELTVVGDGLLVLDTLPDDLTEVNIGSETQNGGFGTDALNELTIKAAGAHSRIALKNLDNAGGSFAGTVVVGDNVSAIDLLTDGTIALGEDAVSSAFNLAKSDETQQKLDGSITATLGNIAGSDLTLVNLSEISKEKFTLRTNAGGSIVFDGDTFATTSTASVSAYSFGAVVFDDSSTTPTSSGVWDSDISGEGGITVQNGADLTLNASTLTYTGKTLVDYGATLTYGAAGGAVSYSSELEVASYGTLVGGVRLVGENANVTFNSGATFVFTGAAIEFTGTAEVASGTLNVVLDDSALSVRGVPVALFRYIGTDDSGYNGIDFDNLSITSSDGLLYYKDTASTDENATNIYVVAPDLANAGVKLHKGTSSNFVRMLNAITKTSSGELQDEIVFNGETIKLKSGTTLTAAGTLAEAIIKTPNGSLETTLNNLSPLGYAAMPAMLQSGFLSDIAAISSRIEQRRYDNYSSFIWETHNDWEFFVQGQGAFVSSDSGTDTRTFDFNTYGAIAGADVKLNAESILGFALAYDFGKATLHDSGGNVKSNDIRATVFFGKLFAEKFYFDTGVQAGYAMFDVKRRTALGSVDGDTNAAHAGAFANLGMLIPLWLSEDEKTGVNLMPFVGLAYSYFSVGGFDESGAGTALDTKSVDANSLRASIGASLAITFPWLERNMRVNLDVAYSRELLDTETDIDYSMPGISASEKYSVSAPTFAEDTFSIGPRFLVELDRNASVYAGYRFEMSTDSDISHSVNIGYRKRF